MHTFLVSNKKKIVKVIFNNKTAIQINNQPDATISPVYYLTFIYSSTCFERPHTHYQELNNCSSSLGFYLQSMVIAGLLVVVGPTMTNSTITILQR
jgi:hypothetical protein